MEEDDTDSLVNPSDPVTQAHREAAIARICAQVWSKDTADVKRIKEKQVPLGRVSDQLVFTHFDANLVLEEILNLIVERLPTHEFIDRHSMAIFKPDLSNAGIQHMCTKFNFSYVIWLCHTSVDFSMPNLFVGVLTAQTVKKHMIPGVMAKPRMEKAEKGKLSKPREYKAVLCNFCTSFGGNEDSAYGHVCHLHLCMAVGCGHCFDFTSFNQSDLWEHF